MKMRFAVLCLLLAMLSAMGCKLNGKPNGTAVINARDIVTKCNDGIRVSGEVQNHFSARREALKSQEEALRKLQNDPALSDPKSAKRDEFQRLSTVFVEANQQFRKDVADEETIKFKPVLDKINKILADYAKEHGLVSVQDKNGFAYVDPSIDITDEVIKRVDQAK